MEGCRLQAHEIACLRGERLLFRGLTLGLKLGEALQVTGANGTGKSSLIRILAGLMRPTSGQVIRRCDIALLDERPALDADRPLGEALAFWQRMDGEEMPLERLGLDGLLEVPVRYLSTGQTKRAALARMIGQGAPVWLLDEPLNGLDADAVTLAEKLVAEHCAGGGIAVIASHQAFALRGMRYLAVEDYVS